MCHVKTTDQVAWLENDGPSKSRGVKVHRKLQDPKMTDQIVGLFRVQCHR